MQDTTALWMDVNNTCILWGKLIHKSKFGITYRNGDNIIELRTQKENIKRDSKEQDKA